MRIAMIGTGYIAGLNGAALAAQPDVQLIALCNRTVEKARKLKETLGIQCPVYADYREMLRSERPDAVVINLAHHLHLECFRACSEAGADIIIEKPLGNTYAECRQMIRAARKNGTRATVCHTQRYNAVYEAARVFLAGEHHLGRLLSVSDSIHIHYFWEGRSPWQLSEAQSGGGIALNYGVHQLDRVHFFMRQKTTAFTARFLAEKPGYRVFSSYVMMGVGDGGTPYTITCTGYSGPAVNETRLIFENGIVLCNLAGSRAFPYGLFYGDNESGDFTPIPVPLSNDQMYHREFRAALDYLSGKTPQAPVPLEWAAEMVRLVEYGCHHMLR